MKVDRIFINTHRYDFEFTRICVASVRYWYPSVPVSLIFDYSNGGFTYKRLCRDWDIGVLDTHKSKYGWGFGKFEPLFLENDERFLVLDADTALAGPVLAKLDPIEADFVVDRETQPPEKVSSLYYDPEAVKRIAPGFSYPGYTFNTGQWVGKGGLIRRSDFDGLVEWQPSPQLKYKDIFKQADQGIFNFLLHQKEKEGKITVEKIPLMIWPGEEGREGSIRLQTIRDKKPDHPFVIHWAGMKFKQLSDYPMGHILCFYNQYANSRHTGLKNIADETMKRYFGWEKRMRNRFNRLTRPKPR
jgi:hypothetical protein